jgi:putative PIN family toxin of toxin-antitoxin system
MRVVLDANVLIAAFAARGLCEAVLELCIANDDIFLTREILADVREKLVKKIKIPASHAAGIIELLTHNAHVVHAGEIPPNTCRDPDHHNVLGVALAAGADYIITGDEDLLSIKQYEGTRIVRPREYWQVLGRRPK